MMELLTFFVLYYHAFFICAAIVMGIDYVLEIDIFKDMREFLDKPSSTVYIVLECLMGIAFMIGFALNSTVIFSALWIVTLILFASVILSLVLYGLHKLLDMEW